MVFEFQLGLVEIDKLNHFQKSYRVLNSVLIAVTF